MEVDAVPRRHQAVGFVLGLPVLPAEDMEGPVEIVAAARRFRPALVIGDEMVERRDRPPDVETVMLVRHGQIDDAARARDPQEGSDRGDRILAVLEKMVCDHEIDGRVRYRGQAFAVVEDVDRDELAAGELRIVMPELLGRQPVDVADPRAGRRLQGFVESADLEAVPPQVVPGDPPPDRAEIGSQPELLPRAPGEQTKGRRGNPQGFVSTSTPTAVPLGFRVIV